MQLCNQYTQFVTPLLDLMFKQVVCTLLVILSQCKPHIIKCVCAV